MLGIQHKLKCLGCGKVSVGYFTTAGFHVVDRHVFKHVCGKCRVRIKKFIKSLR